MDKIIEEKMERQQTEEYYDAFDYMLSSAKELGQQLTIQELKVRAGNVTHLSHGAAGATFITSMNCVTSDLTGNGCRVDFRRSLNHSQCIHVSGAAAPPSPSCGGKSQSRAGG